MTSDGEATYEKLPIATSQLDTALRLFFEEEDLFSAITLAGAAEEILGQLLREAGIKNSFDELNEASARIHESLFGDQVGAKVFGERANRARNTLKHHTPGQPQAVTLDLRQEAIDLLDRAISNYWLIEYDLTPGMERFTQMQRSEGSLKHADFSEGD